jgi:galactokinase
MINTQFKKIYQADPEITVQSPGRINLIGEHTDYNGGYVLPAAIDKSIYFAVSKRHDSTCNFYATNLDQYFSTTLHQLQKSETHPWANYLMGVLDEIQKAGHEIQGIDLVFGGDLPTGLGISSSAAIENGIGYAINELYELKITKLDLVKISQQAENNFVGMKCGIMDMFASMMGKTNQVIRIDCKTLDYQYHPFQAPDLCLVLCNTQVKHSLVDSEYNARRAECEHGVAILKTHYPQIQFLRDATLVQLKKHQSEINPIVFKRCKYVIEEIKRVETACQALQNNDFQTLGKLMYQTHKGLDQLYQVSCPELNHLVQIAKKHPQVLGARLMGGGFGGCTINLVKTHEAQAFIENAQGSYQQKFGRELPCHIVKPEKGVGVVVGW